MRLLIRLVLWPWFLAALIVGRLEWLAHLPAGGLLGVSFGLAALTLAACFGFRATRGWIAGLNLRKLVLLHGVRLVRLLPSAPLSPRRSAVRPRCRAPGAKSSWPCSPSARPCCRCAPASAATSSSSGIPSASWTCSSPRSRRPGSGWPSRGCSGVSAPAPQPAADVPRPAPPRTHVIIYVRLLPGTPETAPPA